jgi:hypothetical protein
VELPPPAVLVRLCRNRVNEVTEKMPQDAFSFKVPPLISEAKLVRDGPELSPARR